MTGNGLGPIINGAGITPSLADPSYAAKIASDDPYVATSAAIGAAQVQQEPIQPLEITVFDKVYTVQNHVGGYLGADVTFADLELPQAQIIMSHDDPAAVAVIECEKTVVPVVIQVGSLRWNGRVDVAHDKMIESGEQTVECQLVHDLTMLDRILVWPEPFLPIEVQPSEAIYIGPAITCLKTMVAENVLRLQLGLWELVNTLGSLDPDWESWFGALLMQRSLSVQDLMQMVTTPICVTFTNPLLDTSPWISFHGRMDTCWKLMVQQLKDNGLVASMDLWLPGEPQPDGVLFPLQVATLVFNIKDYSGVTGPTQTGFDGLIEDVLDFTGSLTGNALEAFLNPSHQYVPPGSNIVIAPVLGVNFHKPWVVFNADLDASGLIAYDFAHHHPLCWNLVLGGRSPQWACAPTDFGWGTGPRANTDLMTS